MKEEWTPTHELRFVEREVIVSFSTVKGIKRFLQQKWEKTETGDQVGDLVQIKEYFEWRDVPLVEEEE